MRPSTLLPTLLTLLPLTTARSPPFGSYNITDYFSDCIGGPDGCFYSFNIAFTPETKYPAPYKSDTEPPFTASCSGSDAQTGYVACNISNVESYMSYRDEDTVDVLFVEHTWNVAKGPGTRDANYTVSGNASVPEFTGEVNPSFQIFPTGWTTIWGA